LPIQPAATCAHFGVLHDSPPNRAAWPRTPIIALELPRSYRKPLPLYSTCAASDAAPEGTRPRKYGEFRFAAAAVEAFSELKGRCSDQLS
jgi:hypothetical protein